MHIVDGRCSGRRLQLWVWMLLLGRYCPASRTGSRELRVLRGQTDQELCIRPYMFQVIAGVSPVPTWGLCVVVTARCDFIP